MNNYEENKAFGFEPENESKNFNYNDISGLGESDYENEDLFNTEVSNTTEPEQLEDFKISEETKLDENLGYTLEYPIDYSESADEKTDAIEKDIQNEDNESDGISNEGFNSGFWGYDQHNSFLTEEDTEKTDEFVQVNNDSDLVEEVTQQLEYPIDQQETEQIESEETEENIIEDKQEDLNNLGSVDTEFLESEENFDSASLDRDYEYSVVEPTMVIEEDTKKEMFTETPI